MHRKQAIKGFFAALLLTPLLTTAQPHALQPEMADSVLQLQPKPVVIFVYTDWCRYCRLMEQTTLKDRELAAFLDRCFYFIRLNAEEKRSIRFLGQAYHYRPTGIQTGEHELAARLRNNRPAAYPALFILSPEGEVVLRTHSYLSPADLIRILEAVLKNRAVAIAGKPLPGIS